jgi:hypothetical protein
MSVRKLGETAGHIDDSFSYRPSSCTNCADQQGFTAQNGDIQSTTTVFWKHIAWNFDFDRYGVKKMG